MSIKFWISNYSYCLLLLYEETWSVIFNTVENCIRVCIQSRAFEIENSDNVKIEEKMYTCIYKSYSACSYELNIGLDTEILRVTAALNSAVLRPSVVVLLISIVQLVRQRLADIPSNNFSCGHRHRRHTRLTALFGYCGDWLCGVGNRIIRWLSNCRSAFV